MFYLILCVPDKRNRPLGQILPGIFDDIEIRVRDAGMGLVCRARNMRDELLRAGGRTQK